MLNLSDLLGIDRKSRKNSLLKILQKSPAPTEEHVKSLQRSILPDLGLNIYQLFTNDLAYVSRVKSKLSNNTIWGKPLYEIHSVAT